MNGQPKNTGYGKGTLSSAAHRAHDTHGGDNSKKENVTII